MLQFPSVGYWLCDIRNSKYLTPCDIFSNIISGFLIPIYNSNSNTQFNTIQHYMEISRRNWAPPCPVMPTNKSTFSGEPTIAIYVQPTNKTLFSACPSPCALSQMCYSQVFSSIMLSHFLIFSHIFLVPTAPQPVLVPLIKFSSSFRFCSIGCQEKAISSHHKYECLLQVEF